MANYDNHLLIKVSELYYRQGYKQQDIANKLKISRSKVSRIITEAKRRNLVEIKINYSQADNIELEKIFEEKFDLKEAVIISTNDSEDLSFNQVTKNAADFLSQKLNKSDILGISWGKTLNNIAKATQTYNYDIEIIQILGNIGANISANSIVRKLGNKFNCNYTLLPAPAIVDNKNIKEALISDSNIKNVLEEFNNISVALIGIGDLSEKSSFYRSGYLDYKDLKKIKNLGVVGDICGRFLKKDGSIVESELNDRIIGIELDQLKKIPYVIGVATGKRKDKAILSALNSKTIDILITDENTARSVINLK